MISVPPKPSRNELKDDAEYLKILEGHHDAVCAILNDIAQQLIERGNQHDMDKITALREGRPLPDDHRKEGHHWYASTNNMLPTFLDIIEMCADTVATTAGKQSLDPWAEQWLPPLQESDWWDDVIRRTELAISEGMLDAPVLNPKRPRNLPTNRVQDD